MKVIFPQMLNEIMVILANYQRNGSGWYFKELISLDIYTVDYKTLKGDSYIPLPDFLMRKNFFFGYSPLSSSCSKE